MPPTLLPSDSMTSEPWQLSGRTLVFVAAIMAVGVLLRVLPFMQEGALWIDEAVLADNLVSKSFAELGRPLDHHQAAPVGFLWVQKCMVGWFGSGERAMRVVPLVASVLLLPATLLLARRVCTQRGTILALLLVALSDPLIYFGNEVKPYMLDALAATVMLWLALRSMQRGSRLGDLLALAFIGSLAVWFSFPVIFVLAGIVGCLAAHAWQQRDRARLVRLALPASLFAISFVINFLLFIRPAAQSQALTDYWKAVGAFMPLPPTSIREMLWFVHTPLNYFIDPGGFRAFGVAIVLVVLGGFTLWRQGRWLLGMLIAPLLIALAAAALKRYPFATADAIGEHWLGRVLVFTLPAALVLLSLGIDRLALAAGRGESSSASSRRQWVVLGFALLTVLIHPLERIVRNLRDHKPGQNVRASFEYLAKHLAPGDRVYPTWPVRQLAAYYRHRFPIGDPTTWINSHPVLVKQMLTADAWVRMNDWQQFELELAAQPAGRLWMFISHEPSTSSKADEKFLKHLLSRHGTILDQHINDEASLYLVQLHAKSATGIAP